MGSPGSASVAYESVRERIIEAADSLYNESGRERVPTVEEVRVRACTGMNATSAVLRDWKMQLSVRPAPVAAVIPESVMEAFMPVLLAAHGALQEEANTNLRAAQANWERERENAESMRAELAGLWEEVANKLEESQKQNSDALARLEHAQTEIAALTSELQACQHRLAAQIRATESAEAQASEAGRRLDDLKVELHRSHEELRESRDELSRVRSAHLEEIKQVQGIAAAELEKSSTALATVRGRLERTEEDLLQLREQSSAEISDLREQSNTQVLQLRTELADSAARLHAAERMHAEQKQMAASAANDQAKRFTTLQTERDNAVSEAAHTAGQLQALQAQVKDLMTGFRGREKP
jgi:colicin import membrane protein